MDSSEQRLGKTQWKRLAGYALSFPQNFFKGIIYLVIAVLLELSAPFIIKYILDTKIQEIPMDQVGIYQMIGLFVVVGILGAILKFAGIVQLRIVAMRVIQKMRNDLFHQIHRLPIGYFDNLPAGKIVSKITNDTAAVENLYVLVLSQFLTSFIYLVGVYSALLVLSPGFGAICLLLVPIFYFFIRIFTVRATKYNHVIREKISDLNGMINESISGMAIISAFNGQKKILKEFEKTNEERFQQDKKLLILECALSHNVIGVMRTLSFVVMIYYFGRKVLGNSGATTVGMLYVYLDYLNTIFQQTNGVFDKISNMQRALVASDHVFQMLDMPGKDVLNSERPAIQGEVSFDEVCFAYKNEDYVLKDISFGAKQGQTIGLVGHTGSGKSSIINLLMKFYAPQKGSILVDGMDIQTLSEQDLRKNLGIVLQDPFLFTGTILSNITLDNPHISREKAIEALELVGGDAVIKNLENGVDEKVVERGSTLSAGQRQLISFARAMAHDPRILILDEATSSVDSETEQIIQRGMRVLMKGRTTFVIAHRLSTVRDADQILLLDKGRIVERGTHEELLGMGGKYASMVHAQNQAIA